MSEDQTNEVNTVRMWIDNERRNILATKQFILGTHPVKSYRVLQGECTEVIGAVERLSLGRVASANLVEELVQVASVAHLWLEYIVRQQIRQRSEEGTAYVNVDTKVKGS